MKELDEIAAKYDEWEDEAKKECEVAGVHKDEQIDIDDHIREHHREEIKSDIDYLDSLAGTVNSRLENEYITEEERSEIDRILEQIEELKDRLRDIL